MTAQFHCRSQQQIDDDFLCDAHAEIERLLRLHISGLGPVYAGDKRDNLKRIKTRIEDAILGADYDRTSLSRQLMAAY